MFNSLTHTDNLKNKKGITLVALVVTVIILLILAGISLSTLGGEQGLFAKVQQARKAQIESEIKEKLILAIQELQIEKQGKATLDDITQEWIDSKLTDYKNTVTEDASINGKRIKIQKDDITKKFIIDENLNIIETTSEGSIEFSYDVGERVDNKVNILIRVQDKENGLSKIQFPDTDAILVEANKKDEKAIDYQVEIGKEYKIIITSENGGKREEIILIADYWHKITKNLGDGVVIDNLATKAAYNKPYQATITIGNEYALDTFTVTMGGTELTTGVDITTGTINIEKVTGDIEITATAKKLEIKYTAIAVGTSSSASNTSSVAANSQTNGTTLYINIIAKLEGTACTVTLKEDLSKTVPYAINQNGKYVFIVTGTYNGKTITEEKVVAVDKYKGAVNVVAYDAGDWTETEIQALKDKSLYNINTSKTAGATNGLNFTFGGFTYKEDTENASYINNGTVMTSRNQSVAPQSGYGTPSYEGWQILEIKDSSGNIIKKETEINSKIDNIENERIYVTKIVHAGSPENFVYYYTTSYDGYRAEYILSSGLRRTSYNTYQARDWQMYIDNSQRDLIADTTDKDGNAIKDIHAMTYDEAKAITGNNYSTTGRRNTGAYYWLASVNNIDSLWDVYYDGRFNNNGSRCCGVRPVISLKSGVYIESGSGVEGDPYVLGIEK